MQERGTICFLSGLRIFDNKISHEHYYPKSRLPRIIYSQPENIYPAHKELNCIKGDLLPCQWEEQKLHLVKTAIRWYHLSNSDRKFLKQTLISWETYKTNPCEYCIANKYKEYCVKGRER